MIDSEAKLDCIRRELKFRRRVYPRMVAEKKMSAALADAQIAIMEEIADDYRQLAEKERLI